MSLCIIAWWWKTIRGKLFPVVPTDRRRGNGHKLKHRKSRVYLWSFIQVYVFWFFVFCFLGGFIIIIMEIFIHLNVLLEPPSLEIWEKTLDMALSNQTSLAWTRKPADVHSYLGCSVNLWTSFSERKKRQNE